MRNLLKKFNKSYEMSDLNLVGYANILIYS